MVGPDPIRDGGFEPLGADEMGTDPDGFESFQELRMVIKGLRPRFSFSGRFPVDGFIGV